MLYWDFSLFYNTVIRGNTALSQSKAVNLLLGQCIIPFSREKVSAFVTGEKKLPQHIVSRVSDRSESKHHIIIQQLELHDTYDCIRPLISTPSVISGIVDAQIIDNWRKLSYETRFEDIIINALLLAVNCTYSIASPVSTNIEKKSEPNNTINTENEENGMVANKEFLCSKGKVFIVHGHDDSAKYEVALALNRLGLEGVILHEQADTGLTIIEKIERFSNVEFAIVLYTECDLGRAKEDAVNNERFRARQNVVFEHGYLLGKLGRDHVFALVKGEVETPGDISGVVYTKMDSAGGWKLRLITNLRAVGIDINANAII